MTAREHPEPREAAAAMGFTWAEAEPAVGLLDIVAAAPGTLETAMDLSRYMLIPLPEAATALVIGRRRLRRLGFDIPQDADPLTFVREQVAGQAEAYTHTWAGGAAVRRAEGRTFGNAVEPLVKPIADMLGTLVRRLTR